MDENLPPQPETVVESTPLKSTRRAWFESIKWTLIFLAIFLLFSTIVVGIFGWRYLNVFAQTAKIPSSQIIQTVKAGLLSQPSQKNPGFKTVLILGTDQLDTRPGSPVLTDTILLATINLQSGRVNLLSLPRDLWDPKYQTRINAYYFYGQDRTPGQPELFAATAITEFTQIEFDHILVIGIEQLAELVEILDGVEINVPSGFVDPEFPRPDVDVTTVTDPELLYETVSFEAGPQIMDANRALQYVRSRKSPDDQGTDTARSIRQQQLIQAIMAKILTPQVVASAETTGRLYGWYQNQIDQSWPTEDLIATAKSIYPAIQRVEIQTNQVSISDDQTQGSIYHPPVAEFQGQWVYSVQDLDLFLSEVKNKLFAK